MPTPRKKPETPPANPANPEEGCYSCKYLDVSKAFDDPATGEPMSVGACRRYAPHPIVTVTAAPMITLFPAMRADEWCGEYEAAPPHVEHAARPAPAPPA